MFSTKKQAVTFANLRDRALSYPKSTRYVTAVTADKIKKVDDGWRTASCSDLIKANLRLTLKRLVSYEKKDQIDAEGNTFTVTVRITDDYDTLLELMQYADDSRGAAHELPRLQLQRMAEKNAEAERERVIALDDDQLEAELSLPEPVSPAPALPPRYAELRRKLPHMPESWALDRAKRLEAKRVRNAG